MADFEASVGVDLSEARAALTNLTATARKAFKAFETAAASASEAADKLRPQIDKMNKSMGNASAAAQKYGKNVLVASAATTAGVVAALAYVAALKAVVTQTVAAVRAAGEWSAELEKAGVILDRDVVANIEDANSAMDGLTLQSKAMGVEVVDSIIDPFMRAVDAGATLLVGLDRLNETTPLVSIALRGLSEMVMQLIPGMQTLTAWADLVAITFPDAAAAVREFRDAAADTEEEIDKVGIGLSDWLRVMPNVNDTLRELGRLTRERTKAEAELAREAAKREKEADAAALRAIDLQFTIMENNRIFQKELREARAELEATTTLTLNGLEVLEERVQSLTILDFWKELGAAAIAFAGELSGPVFNALSNINKIQQTNTQRELTRIDTVQAARLSSLQEQTAAIESNENLSETAKEAEIKRLNKVFAAQSAGLTKQEAEFQKQFIKQFKGEKRAAVAEATINGAVAITSALSVLPPFGAILAAGIGASVATQIGVIQSQQPPTFQAGGMVGDRLEGDHVLIGADPREGILTPGGVDAAGGPAGVDALNSGRGMGPTHIEIHLPGVMVARSISNDRQTKRAVIHIVESELRKRGL